MICESAQQIMGELDHLETGSARESEYAVADGLHSEYMEKTAPERRLADHRLRLCFHGVIRDAPLGTPLGAPHMDTSSPNTHASSQPTPNWMRAVPADQLPDQDRPRAWWGCCSWPVLRWQRS
jgi:hypothetical protein